MTENKSDKLSKEEEKRLSDLFNRLDVDNDNKISITDLTKAIKSMELESYRHPDHYRQMFERIDSKKDGHIDFAEFVHYITEHEKKLRVSFNELDKNNDGFIDVREIQEAFNKIGVDIDLVKAQEILVRMDKDRTLLINWHEWRDYHLLQPVSSTHEIVHHHHAWRHDSIIDVGEDVLVPDDFTEGELRSGMWWRHLVAGAAAGAMSRTCTAPLDRLKVFIMVFSSRQKGLGLQAAWKQLICEGGWKGMWRGNGVNVIKIAPESAIKFMAYEQIKRNILKATDSHELSFAQRFFAGSLAGATAQTIIYPMEVVKTRLVLRKTKQYSGMVDCALSVYRNEGPRNLYRGYVPNLMGILPYAGIDLAVYETLKRKYIAKHSSGDDPGVLVLLACGTISSSCGQLVSYPLSLVRTRMQAKPHWQQGVADTLRDIWREEKLPGLYRGIVPNFMKVAPAVGISYIVYEHVRKLLGVNMT